MEKRDFPRWPKKPAGEDRNGVSSANNSENTHNHTDMGSSTVNADSRKPTGTRKRIVRTVVACLCGAVLAVGVWHTTVRAPQKQKPMGSQIIDFHMFDLQRGELLVSRDDGRMEIWATGNGGSTFTPQVVSDQPQEVRERFSQDEARPAAGLPERGAENPAGPGDTKADAAASRGAGAIGAASNDAAVERATTGNAGAASMLQGSIGKVEFVTPAVGWALMSSDDGQNFRVTVDGGQSFRDPADPQAVEAIAREQARLDALEAAKKLEKAYFGPGHQTDAEKIMNAEWTLLPDAVDPGDVVLVRHNQPGEIAWQGKTYKLMPFGTGYYTYLPVPILLKPGSYPVGGLTLTVRDKTFPTDRLQVSDQLASLKQNTERIEQDQKKIDQARSHSADTFLFPPDSPFIVPVQGRLSTPYGYTRYVNGKYDGSHTAVDIAAPQGTPVKAANDGIVVLAETLYLTGNSIYIDHGMDLFSQYIHLSEMKVKAGDHVKQGQVIGLVGQTGFATGPHLHFTFWAHNVPVNPNLFYDTTPFHWSEVAG